MGSPLVCLPLLLLGLLSHCIIAICSRICLLCLTPWSIGVLSWIILTHNFLMVGSKHALPHHTERDKRKKTHTHIEILRLIFSAKQTHEAHVCHHGPGWGWRDRRKCQPRGPVLRAQLGLGPFNCEKDSRLANNPHCAFFNNRTAEF